MRTVIVSINSRFIHSALAPWYLKAACGSDCGEIEIVESTINDLPDDIMVTIYEYKPDVIAFSCYIWNIGMVLKLAENLKKVLKDVVIVLGGPEVSFDSAGILGKYPFIDYILSGEGEISFPRLLKQLSKGENGLDDIEGLTRRQSGTIIATGGYAVVKDLDRLPSPYTDEMLKKLQNRIVYFESSRGCPFSCSYCISSTFNGVRYFSLDRVFNDLDRLIYSGARQVKFVDRTFNCNPKRARKIFKYIIEKWGTLGQSVNFHFEAAADLFDEDMLEILASAPEGLFQFEIGIQSTSKKTLEAVNRKSDLEKVFKSIKALLCKGNIHIHLDLIAGLPYEDLSRFKISFNEVYRLFPHKLQLGFLKLLKGTEIRNKAQEHGYIYKSQPPYEVLRNDYIGYDDIIELKRIEELVERYFNSGRFRHTLRYLLDATSCTPYEFYRDLMLYCLARGYLEHPVSSRELYNILMDFFLESGRYDTQKLNELMKLDFLSADSSGKLPDKIERTSRKGFREACFDFLGNPDNINRFLPDYAGNPAKEIYKKVHFEIFLLEGKLSVYLFDYGSRSRVTGLYRYFDVSGAFGGL